MKAGLIATLAALSSPLAVGAQKPFGLEDAITLISSGVAKPRILNLLSQDCVAFALEADVRQKLVSAGASQDLIRDLEDVCYVGPTLLVKSEPAGAEVWLGNDLLGTTPWKGNLMPRERAGLEIRQGDWRTRTTLELVGSREFQLTYAVPTDANSLPASVSPTVVVRDKAKR